MVIFQAFHWYHMAMLQEYKLILLSGIRYFHHMLYWTVNHLAILDISDNLVESLALDEYELKLKKAMVDNIERITITTINSTRVKAFLIWYIFIFLHLLYYRFIIQISLELQKIISCFSYKKGTIASFLLRWYIELNSVFLLKIKNFSGSSFCFSFYSVYNPI